MDEQIARETAALIREIFTDHSPRHRAEVVDLQAYREKKQETE